MSKINSSQTKKVTCAFCKGKGLQPYSSITRCLACQGQREITFKKSVITCPVCRGKGRAPNLSALTCLRCRGIGVIEEKRKTEEKSGEVANQIKKQLGEITKKLKRTKKEMEKKTKEIKKRIKPIKSLRLKQTKGFIHGLGKLFGLVLNLEKEGVSKYEKVGEIYGKTKSGKEYKSAYGFKVKVGLNKP